MNQNGNYNQQEVKDEVGFWGSIKTKLILVMVLVVMIPMIISVVVSYVSSTNKAMTDVQDILEWQAWYIEDAVAKIIETNASAMTTFATAPSTIAFLQDPSGNTVPEDIMLQAMQNIDKFLNDGNGTILTDATGQQLIRTVGQCINSGEKEYFRETISGKYEVYCSNLQVSTSTGDRMFTIAVPVHDNVTGEVIGIVQRNYRCSDLHDFLKAESDDAFVADRNGDLLAHSQYSYGTGAGDHEEESRKTSEFMVSGKDEGFYSADTGKGYHALIAYVKEPLTGFTIVAATNSKEAMASARSAAISVIVVGVVLVIAAVIISFTMAKSFADPIMAVSQSLGALANGVFQPVQNYESRKDEFGTIARATNFVISTLGGIVSNIKHSALELGASSEELSDMADQISHTADDVANAVSEIATGATQQADEIQHANESVDLIGNAVSEVQASTDNLSELAGKMKSASEVSGNSLSSLQSSAAEMTVKIEEIARMIQSTQDAVNIISEKVEGITSIATQTNLLSLNASIEAARAGESGRGFAVVAEEIGKLADDSKQMADEIKKEMDVLLRQSQAAVGAAEEVKEGNCDQQIALRETLEAVEGMLTDINSTVNGVHLIGEGAKTCDSSKNAVVDTMSALSAISEENAASSEQTGASMEELSATVTTLASSANDLRKIAEKLNHDMQFFKS